MLFVRRNDKMKKKIQGEVESELWQWRKRGGERWNNQKKRKRGRQRKVGDRNSAPTVKLSLRLSQLSRPKKKKTLCFKVFKYLKSQIFNSKFLFPNFQIHILNAQILNSTLQFSIKIKLQISWSRFWALILKTLKAQNFRF